MGMRIVIGCDDAGIEYKKVLKADLDLDPRVDEVIDVGVHEGEDTAYTHIGVAGARAVAEGRADRALLICGTGMGVAMAANKVPGIRAALCYDKASARNSREHNNANVLTLGGRLLSAETALETAATWPTTPFGGGRHQKRIDKITAIEQRYSK